MDPERDDYDEDDEREEFASRSIFAAGWFRAVLVLTVLAIVVVVSLPYLLNWFEPAPPPTRTATPAVEPPRPPASVERPAAPAPAIAPATPATPAQPAVPPTSAPRPAPATPPAPAPAPKAAAEKPATSTASKAAADKPTGPGTPKSTDRAGSPAAVARAPAGGGGYWVQLGVFKDAKNAESLAKTVRDQGFPAEVARVSRAGTGGAGTAPLHEIFVTEAGVEKVNAALKGKGSAQPAPGGVVVKPSFALQEAMTVSKQLSGSGLKVVVRPAGSAAQATYHVVRAGGYADRARAIAALEQIKRKGHEGFVTQGPAR